MDLNLLQKMEGSIITTFCEPYFIRQVNQRAGHVVGKVS